MRVTTAFVHLSVLILLVVSSGETAKILLLPINMNSHLILFSQIGKALGHLGHKTVMLVASNAKIPHHMAHENFTIMEFAVPEEIPFCSSSNMSEFIVESALAKSKLWILPKIFASVEKLVDSLQSDIMNLWNNAEIMTYIKEYGFEFAIPDLGAGEFSFLIPYYLGIPYAPVSIHSGVALTYRVPRLSSFVSLIYTDKMTFQERFATFLYDILLVASFTAKRDERKTRIANIRLPSMLELSANSSLWFFTEDPVLVFPRPHMPNTISIGDIMGRPGKPLPCDLQEHLDNSPEGTIIVSLGSYFDYIPNFLARSFCDAFRNTSYQFIWKLKTSPQSACDSPNVRIYPWLPQNDILAHKNCRLFITHGGFNSLAESSYHGKPLIVFPMSLDQPGNAALAVARGYAITMQISDFSSSDLKENIERILKDDMFTLNARHASKLLQDKSESTAERMSYLIEHVLKFGDKHLRTEAFKLSIFEFLMVDIFAFLFVAFLLATGAIIAIVRYCILKLDQCIAKAEKVKVA